MSRNKLSDTKKPISVDDLPMANLSVSSPAQASPTTPKTPTPNKHKGDKDHYVLTRSDSGMSEYSDLVEFMLVDQLGDKHLSKQDENSQYKTQDVIIQTPKRAEAQEKIKKLESENKSLAARARPKSKTPITVEEKDKRQAENRAKKSELKKQVETLPENTEIDYESAGLEDKKMHLFRGKNLNSKLIDPKTKKQRVRTPQEIIPF